VEIVYLASVERGKGWGDDRDIWFGAASGYAVYDGEIKESLRVPLESEVVDTDMRGYQGPSPEPSVIAFDALFRPAFVK
jgi:hypothetical protein